MSSSHPENSSATSASGTDVDSTPPLDLCLIGPHPATLLPLAEHFRSGGHRVITTDPGRLPVGSEWEAFDLVLIDRMPGSDYPVVPARDIHQLVALCEPGEIVEPAVLRAAMRAGARDLLPRTPDYHGWPELLGRSRPATPGVILRFSDPETHSERQLPLDDEMLVVGRDPQSRLIFPHPFVSRRHARIFRAGSRFRIEDLGSRHGTFVGDRAIESHVLEDGDVIQLGGSQGPQLTFEHTLSSSNTIQVFDATGVYEGDTVNREVHDIAVLLETFLSLNGDLVQEEILEIVLNRSIEFVNADRGLLLMSRERPGASSELDLALARGRGGRELSAGEVEIDRGAPLEVLASGKGRTYEETVCAPGLDPAATASLSIRSAMCVPLRTRESYRGGNRETPTIGVLYVDSESRGRPFSPRALDALGVLASEVANAIHSASLYEDSLKKRKMDEEMAIAQSIHENIFQRQALTTESWEVCGDTSPSQQVGGDFLSGFDIGDGRLAVVLGDVSGKGVPAALFSTLLEGLFHGLVSFRPDLERPGKAIEALNRILLSKSRLRKFVTVIFAYLAPDGTLRYVNAGHDPGLVLRADGSQEELEACGTILGMFPEAEYRSQLVRLRPDDRVILFSDGIPEARSPEGEVFGRQRLLDLALEPGPTNAEELHERISSGFLDFLDGAPARDDVTLLTLRYRG